jgi:hypothetical protein
MGDEFYEQSDEGAFDNESGIWDSEDQRYIMHTQRFSECRASQPELRPYEIAGGEITKYRLQLTLNEVGGLPAAGSLLGGW